PSREALCGNMSRTIAAYNSEVERFDAAHGGGSREARADAAGAFVDRDPSRISWSAALIENVVRCKLQAFNSHRIRHSLYRPFTPSWLYYDRAFNERVYQMPRIFPLHDSAAENRVIMLGSPGGKVSFCALMTVSLPSLHAADM